MIKKGFDIIYEVIELLLKGIETTIRAVDNLLKGLKKIGSAKVDIGGAGVRGDDYTLPPSLMGEKQTGGYIPSTGLYKLHAGEYVQPRRSPSVSMGTVIMNFYGVTNADEIAKKVERVLGRRYRSALMTMR